MIGWCAWRRRPDDANAIDMCCEECGTKGCAKKVKLSFWAQVLGCLMASLIASPIVAAIGWGARIALALAIAVGAGPIRSETDDAPEGAAVKRNTCSRPLSVMHPEKGAEKLSRLSH
jgi:hypothetical protein